MGIVYERQEFRSGLATNNKRALTAAATLTKDDYFVTADATGGAFTITLPAAADVPGQRYVITRINSGANAVTIDGNASENINGATTLVLAGQYSTAVIVCDGSKWFTEVGGPITVEDLAIPDDLTISGDLTVTGTATLASSQVLIRKLTQRVQHSDLTDADTSQDIAIAGFPANSFPLAALIEADTAFTGGTVSAITVSIGDAGAATEIMQAVSVFSGTGFKQGAAGTAAGAFQFEAAYSPIARFTSTDGNVADTDAGDLYVHLYYVTAAAVT